MTPKPHEPSVYRSFGSKSEHLRGWGGEPRPASLFCGVKTHGLLPLRDPTEQI